MLSMLFATVMVQSPSLTVPAFTAYIEPKEESAEVDQNGVTKWVDAKQSVVWYGKLNSGGTLKLALALEGPDGKARYEVVFDKLKRPIVASTNGTIDLGEFQVAKAGEYHRIALKCLDKSPKRPSLVKSLTISGPASKDAEFNLTERRNAASVHCSYPLSKEDQVEWFFNQVEAKTVPTHSFYMACGFHRGYFGMQVNSPTERRVIFSVWDSGNEAVSRDKVGAEDRVSLLSKGAGVVAGDFGNEGTGGHSHMVYPWKQGEIYQFALHAEPKDGNTVYTAYFKPKKQKEWLLIASFRAPKDGSYLKGLHSFNENFWGTNGNLQRLALYGPACVRLAGGEWKDLSTARFTHDGHGKVNRRDYYLRAVGDRFALSNGGFVADAIKYGDAKERKPAGIAEAKTALQSLINGH